MTRDTIAGLILAGGLSRRMGGGDKGLMHLGGQSILARIADRMAPQVGLLAINANGDPARFADLRLPVVPDTIDGFQGPLAGVLAGLQWAKSADPAITHLATTAADAPFLPTDLVARLAAAVATRPGAIAMAMSADKRHPVIGLWPLALADDLERSLSQGTRKVQAWADRHGAVAVPFDLVRVDGETVDPFFNANTPADLDEARRLLALLPP